MTRDEEQQQASAQALGPLGVLVVSLERAEGLRAADTNGFSDPYCVVSLDGRPDCKWTSRTRCPATSSTITLTWGTTGRGSRWTI